MAEKLRPLPEGYQPRPQRIDYGYHGNAVGEVPPPPPPRKATSAVKPPPSKKEQVGT